MVRLFSVRPPTPSARLLLSRKEKNVVPLLPLLAPHAACAPPAARAAGRGATAPRAAGRRPPDPRAAVPRSPVASPCEPVPAAGRRPPDPRAAAPGSPAVGAECGPDTNQ
jgi:hypothetical protein